MNWLGRAILAHGAVGELGPVLAMSILLTGNDVLASLAVLLLFAAAAGVVAWVPQRILERRPGTERVLAALATGTNQLPVRLVFLLLLVLMTVAEVFDLDVVLGAFAAGMILRRLIAETHPGHPCLEAWTTATALLTATSTLRVGALVLCNNFRHPVVLGRMATTLDIVSGGRLEFGLGSGSIREEHTRAGLAWGAAAERAGRLGEALEIITSMFAHERTTFAGAHYRVDDIANVPGPVQRPRPPVHIGGTGPKYTLPLVARYADVWNVPTYGLPDRQ
uniref:LLM class flavin-dependent oxidoreductase n=1 Tax=Nocardia testacea TaxID=248551 RepID=UPI001FDFB211